jgi:flagellar hook assembly protein FlgD
VAGVYDVRGALVRTLVDGELEAGYHPLFWDGRSNAGRSRDSGVYFIQVFTGDQKSSTRFVRLN